MSLDIDNLEALARSATSGPWADGGHTVYQSDEVGGEEICKRMSAEDSAFVAAANPATVLQLIQLARKATSGSELTDPDQRQRDYLAGVQQGIAEERAAQQAALTVPAAGACQPLADERSLFEVWARRTHRRLGTNFDQAHDGTYKDNRIAAKWSAWKARAAIAHPIGQQSPSIDQQGGAHANLRDQFDAAFLSMNGFHTKAELAAEWSGLSGMLFRAGAAMSQSKTQEAS